ncbi:MAG: hypothetical protein H0X41_14595 [Chitinophagaceae bacterium]|nr:hypothetical protein [Chitinophagaceae bacterium]
MITVRTNINLVSGKIVEQLRKIKDREYLLRPIAFDVITLMTERIHKDGNDSKGEPIGSYSSEYLKRRQSKAYNRTGDKKIIVSLTRQLENDWSVIATPKGYGIGFLNGHNLDKARWVEENKGKIIFNLSEKERDYATEKLNQLIADAISQ